MPVRAVPLPRLLLVEDDLVSRGFLQAALETLPAEVDCADTARAALRCAQHHSHDLWLIDVNLPDGDGTSLLTQLRHNQPDTPALAHTADTSAPLASRLRNEGFQDVLVKPMSRDALLRSVRAALPVGSVGQLPTWDEERALLALNGQQDHLKALRGLFMGELPGVRDAIAQAQAAGDQASLTQHLHRLQASCGFVGAARLGHAAAQLQRHPGDAQARTELEQALGNLLSH